VTRARDTTMVGQGLAAACLAHGVTAITANKLSLEFAFGSAWRAWPAARQFPDVHGSFDRNDILHMLRKSEGRRSPLVAAWSDEQGWWAPYVLQELDDAAYLLPRFEPNVTWSDWLSLATGFLSNLKPEEIERAQ